MYYLNSEKCAQGVTEMLSDSPGIVKQPVRLAWYYHKLPDRQAVFAEMN